MLRRLNALFKSPRPAPAFDAPLAPDAPFYAVGDIHGRADLLAGLMERLDADHAARGAAAEAVVFLGDYIDRGDNSAEVLARLRQAAPLPVICLAGNHEQMLLDFLDRPEERGQRWLANGGLQTLASFRIGGLSEGAGGAALTAAADQLRAALGADTEAWLRGLPRTWQSGNVVCVHAALDPAAPVEAQDDRTLIWGHRDFLTTPRGDATWVVHGHTITDRAGPVAGRIPLDTGAWYTGRLTLGFVGPGTCEIL